MPSFFRLIFQNLHNLYQVAKKEVKVCNERETNNIFDTPT
jgi:hypothetical protein